MSNLNNLILAIRDTLKASRALEFNRYKNSVRCGNLLRALSRCTDQALNQLIQYFPLPVGSAFIAVGGYGRGELYPYSDVDVLILLPSPPENQHLTTSVINSDAADVQAQVSALLTACWDLGLEIGSSTRTIEQCLAEAKNDITIETALLEARFLSGSRRLFLNLQQAMRRQLNPADFFRAKQLEMQQRHTKYQDTPFALEPNCKESPGGLRDLQVILWMARAARFGKNWFELACVGLLTQAEARELRRCERAFQRLRIELHLLTARREDRLVFDVQNQLAMVYGFQSNVRRRASEQLMQRYYWAAKAVSQLNTILIQNIEERLWPSLTEQSTPLDADFCYRGELLEIRDAHAFEKTPALLLKAFLVFQQNHRLKGMSAGTLRALWHARKNIDNAFRQDINHKQLFIKILQQPQGIVHVLRLMNNLSILPNYLPPFRRIVGQMQHDLFHAYTVDQHILMVIRNLRRFTMPEHAHEYPLCSERMANFDRPWLLYIAALFHDIAKGRGGDHSELGAADAKRFCRQHKLASDEIQLVEFLVRHHLTLSATAQKKDLSDPQVIQEFATLVKDERTLTALYLLTVADIRGTSPKVWNAWKAKLIEELFQKTLKALGGEQPHPNAILENRQKQAAQALREAGYSDELREAFWQQLDIAYFLRHEQQDIIWQTAQLCDVMNTKQAIVRIRADITNNSWQILVYAPDQADLFTRICAFLDEQNLNILEARIHTTRHGYALDTFWVVESQDPLLLQGLTSAQVSILKTWMDKTAETLQTQLLPSASMKKPLKGRLSRQSRLFPVNPSLTLTPDDKADSWILSITAVDRTGLLYSVAQIFARYQINLQTAKITTLGERAEDTFLINGPTLNQTKTQIQFEKELMDALS